MPTQHELYRQFRCQYFGADQPEDMTGRDLSCTTFDGRVTFQFDGGLDLVAVEAYKRAAQIHRGHEADLPDVAGLEQLFPGVDPRGNFSEKDMAFSQRMDRLRTASQLCPKEHQAVLKDFFARVDAPNQKDTLGVLYTGMKKDCKCLRDSHLAARLCSDPTVGDLIERTADQSFGNSGRVQQFNTLLSTMEKVAGLAPEPLTNGDRALLQTHFQGKHPQLPANAPTGSQVSHSVPDKLGVRFPDFRNVVGQIAYTHPNNWEKPQSQIPKELADNPYRDGVIGRYAAGCVKNALDPVFGRLEREGLKESEQRFANRANMTIIDGMTVEERMQQEFHQLRSEGKIGVQEEFGPWYARHMPTKANEMVAAALMQGRQVEVFIPDAKGNLPQRPMKLTNSGFQPAKEKYALNGFERFLSKFGFFKEKAAKAKEMEDARDRVRARYLTHQISRTAPTSAYVRDQFFGPWSRANHNIRPDQAPNLDSSFRVERSGHVTACVCMLAAKGHSLQDILDPTKLQNEKAAAGQLYMQKATPVGNTPEQTKQMQTENRRWLGSVYAQGAQALVFQVDALMQANDLRDPKKLEKLAPILGSAATIFKDVEQEADFKDFSMQTRVGFMQQMRRQAEGRGLDLAVGDRWSDSLMERLFNMSAYLRRVSGSVSNRSVMMDPGISNPDLSKGICQEFSAKMMTDAYYRAPKGHVWDTVDFVRYDDAATSNLSLLSNTVAEKMCQKPERWKEYANAAARGQLAQLADCELLSYRKSQPPQYHLTQTADGLTVTQTKGVNFTPDYKIALTVHKDNLIQLTGAQSLRADLYHDENHIRTAEEAVKTAHALQATERTKTLFQNAVFPGINTKQLPKLDGIGIRTGREAPVNYCMARLAERFELEDILDPNKLRDEKLEVGKEYLRIVSNPTEEQRRIYTDGLVNGTTALKRQIGERLQRLDFSNQDQLRQVLPVMYTASHGAFDLSQEINLRSNVEFYGRTRPGLDAQAHKSDIANVTCPFRAIKPAFESAVSFYADPTAIGSDVHMAKVLCSKFICDDLTAKMRVNPRPWEDGTFNDKHYDAIRDDLATVPLLWHLGQWLNPEGKTGDDLKYSKELGKELAADAIHGRLHQKIVLSNQYRDPQAPTVFEPVFTKAPGLNAEQVNSLGHRRSFDSAFKSLISKPLQMGK